MDLLRSRARSLPYRLKFPEPPTHHRPDPANHEPSCSLQDPDSWNIRLLVLPERNSTVHSGEFRTVIAPLKALPRYCALSYTWDVEPASKSITLNGARFAVRPNLAAALVQLVRRAPYRLVWIDAICIDQENVEERSAQVQIMSVIYARADLVFVWLGPHRDESERAFDASALKCLTEHPPAAEEVVSLRRAFGDLALRPWWARLWVAQEVIFAPSAWVLCGDSMAWWPVLLTCLRKCSNSYYGDQEAWSKTDRACAIALQEADLFSALANELANGNTAVLDVMSLLRFRKATDPRDKVYATLSFCEEEDMGDFRIDYARSVAQVYTDLVEHLLRKRNSCDFLAYCVSRERRQDLPSWVPDWSDADILVSSIARLSTGSAEPVYHAGGSVPMGARIDREDSTLTLQGVFLHHIYQQTHTNSLRIGDGQVGTIILWLWSLFHFAQLSTDPRDDAFYNSAAFTRAFVAVITTGKYVTALLSDEQINAMAGWIEEQPQSISARSRVREDGLKGMQLQEFLNLYKDSLADSTSRRGDLRDKFKVEIDEIDIVVHIVDIMNGRNLAITFDGELCVVPEATKRGDELFVPVGGSVPLVLRPSELGGTLEFSLVGDCYVHGGMMGEFLKDVRQEELVDVVLR